MSVLAMVRSISLAVSSAALVVALGCSEDPASLATQRAPSRIVAVSGDQQSVAGNAMAPLPLVVRVTDAAGQKARGVRVNWSSSNSAVPDAAVSFTDSAGEARTSVRILGVYDTTVVIQASVEKLPPATFALHVEPAPLISLTITSPRDLLVREFAQLAVSGQTALGAASNLEQVEWRSSNPAFLRVTPQGVATALARGSVTITARSGEISATVNVLVTARLRIQPFGLAPATIAVGDTIQLKAKFVDVNGEPIPDEPNVLWYSSRPDLVTVSTTGLISARQPTPDNEYVTITAETEEEGWGAASFRVLPAASGVAKVRFVHAASSLGALTFTPNKGAAVKLTFGETALHTVSPGALSVFMQGFPRGQYSLMQEFGGVVSSGEELTLYASGDTLQAFLIPAWDRHPVVPGDRALVRIVMASGYTEGAWTTNTYLLPPGAPMKGVANFCYFDLPGVSEYMPLPAEEFDIVVMAPNQLTGTYDNPGIEFARLRAKPEAGHATTFVVTGHSRATMRLLTFIDP